MENLKVINNPHSRNVDELLQFLKTSPTEGLSSSEVDNRLESFGENRISKEKEISKLSLFFNQFKSWLVFVLLIAALISYLTGHIVDAIVIVMVANVNAVIGFLLEYRADRSLRALKQMLVLKSKVIRDGELKLVDAHNLVPGDIIIVEEGDKIPADARLIKTQNLRTIESSITGESLAIDKTVETVNNNSSIGDRKNMLFAGTLVVHGKGTAVISNTGLNTVIGQIAEDVSNIESTESHFSILTKKLSKQMAGVAVLGALVIFIVGFFINKIGIDEIFLFSIASLVSAIPEGLPVVLTVVLAVGSHRMSRQKAIIRDLKSSETLGIVDVIATDKTGTLTQNTMDVEDIILASNEKLKVSGSGWDINGVILTNSKEKAEIKGDLLKLVQIAYLSNSSKLIKEDDKTEVIGDPTEAALKVLGEKAFLEPTLEESIVFDLPFDTQYKYRATLVSEDKIYVVGAPEVLLSLSDTYLDGSKKKLTKEKVRQIEEGIFGMSHNALRVISLAYIDIKDKKTEITHDDIKNLTFVGSVGMKDPVRPETIDAIRSAKEAGIRVLMLTGDHKETAIAVAKEIGITENDNVITESELQDISDNELKRILKTTNVYARLNPSTKLRIAKNLQELGFVVAMTGDGVNDGPALKQADIGISMGLIGTDTARESSEIVLADDNFASIIKAVEEGRIVFNNVRRASTFLVTTNVAEQITILITLFLGLPLPLLTSQILWLNLVTDGVNDFALAMEKGHGSVLKMKPRKRTEGILTKQTIWFVIIMSIIMAGLTLTFFVGTNEADLDKARTLAFLAMSFTQLFNALNLRSFSNSLFNIGIFSNKYVVYGFILSALLNIVAIYFAPLRDMLHFTYVEIELIILIFLLSSLPLWIGEIIKLISRLRGIRLGFS